MGCRTAGATDLPGQFFSEALVEGLDEASRAIAHDDSAVFFHRDQLESGDGKFFGQLRNGRVAKGAERFPPQVERFS